MRVYVVILIVWIISPHARAQLSTQKNLTPTQVRDRVNQFKDDRQVAFLFIDKEGYDFHVLFDHMRGADALVDKYGVKGIPTKIVIDPNGRVRFKSSGSSSVVKDVVDEIRYKVGYIKELTEKDR